MRKTIFLRDTENRLFIMLCFLADASGCDFHTGFFDFSVRRCPGSDSHTGFFDFSVRRCAGFGLSHRVFRLLCPKVRRVRTLTPGFSPSLSEVGPGSDSHTGFFDFSVRRCAGFGLSLRVFRLLCPKVHRVRTLPLAARTKKPAIMLSPSRHRPKWSFLSHSCLHRKPRKLRRLQTLPGFHICAAGYCFWLFL